MEIIFSHCMEEINGSLFFPLLLSKLHQYATPNQPHLLNCSYLSLTSNHDMACETDVYTGHACKAKQNKKEEKIQPKLWCNS